MSKHEEGIRMSTQFAITNSNNRSRKDALSASGITSLISDIKKPADRELESVATIFPLYPPILKDFIVLIPAGAEEPGTRMVFIWCLGKDTDQSRLNDSYGHYNISIYAVFTQTYDTLKNYKKKLFDT